MGQKNFNTKLLFFLNFSLTIGFGLVLLSLTMPAVQAVDVTVGANVATTTTCGNGIQEGSEACDGSSGAGNCYNNHCKADCTCPVCGNGSIEAGEGCESSSDCSEGYFCNASCLCQLKGGPQPCIPNCAGKVCGPNGCGGSCGTCPAGKVCIGGQCVPPPACGNGVVDPGEQCDDGNTSSGDCCSSSCTIELLITNVTKQPITNTTATINWTTPCQPTNSLLEWGKTIAVAEGSASLSGQTYSHTITGLEPNTVYYYRITATAGALQTISTGSFLTLGGIEDCNNQTDDDNDGFCDYPASICTDGSTPGDPECICSPNFICTPGLCQPNGKWIVTCIDQTIPKCQPDYEYEQDCEVCPGIFCDICQELEEETCTCIDLLNCCGNDICEPPAEDPYNCPADCPVTCLSDWECTDWVPVPCPPSGIQTRECFDRNACEVPINPPPLQRACGEQCPGLTCGTCQQINLEQCICEELIPCCGNGICEIGETHEQCPADCILPCEPNWTCLAWGPCLDGIQRRECYDLNNCDLNLDRPPEVRSCLPECEIACGLCQQINLSICSCLPLTPCCGNHICERGETVWSCSVDCGLPPELRIRLTQCLDGLDNDKDGLVDYPADPGCSKPSDDSELNFIELLQNMAKLLREKIFDNPVVEKINERFAAPIAIVTVAINTFTTFSLFNLISYLQYLLTQPLAALFRRRRKKWGVVYNSLTKQPVDLAIVRLYQQQNARLVQSRVTDKFGRYNFLVHPGRYYIAVTKPNYTFPTEFLKDRKEDVKYLDLYHGEIIEVKEDRAAITLNIPLDPQEDIRPATKVIFQYYLRKVQYATAFSAVPFAAISLAISPGLLTLSLLGFHCLLYILFRRLGYQRSAKSWGIIYDKENRKAINLAFARIYDKQYNKLLETRVTDMKGRYAFLVDNNIYYLTAEKVGYKPEKTGDIDLISKKREAIIGLDIGLQKGVREKIKPPTPPVVLPAPPPPVPPPAPPEEKPPLEKLEEKVEDLGVGRGSLEDLLKAKETVKEIKEEIEEEKEKLEELEDKVESIEEEVEEKIEEKSTSVPPQGGTPAGREEKAAPLEKPEERRPEESKPEPEKKPDKSKEFKDSIFG